MELSRRDFLKYCTTAAAALGLSASELGMLREALANPTAPTVLWLQGSACAGCSISLLNRVSANYAPKTATELLVSTINLAYHQVLMGAAGDTAVEQAQKVLAAGNYVLVVEGGVPTAFNGRACIAYSYQGVEHTFLEMVQTYSAKAAAIVCVGTCASYGGIPASGPNPTGILSVKAATGKPTINIPGCPTNPDWIVWAVSQLLIGAKVDLDSYGRPSALFTYTVHDQCPRNGLTKTATFGVDDQCLMNMGCRGPATTSPCPIYWWNGKTNWCINANAPCLGCTEPTFPSDQPFYYPGVGGTPKV